MSQIEDCAVVLCEDCADDPQAVYNAVRFVTQFVPDGPALALALAGALADCLRTVPIEERGAVTQAVLDNISNDVRASLT
jgi:hypothetical protein